MADLSKSIIKGYELREQIGAGGFGAVYRAFQPVVEREVAIKVILPEHANQPEFIRNFEAEAQIVARLEHPFIIPLFDYWREPDGAYLVMRFLRGGSLRNRLRDGRIPTDEALHIIDNICAALASAHRSGVVHRDLKPDNILLDEEGNAYLTDFGIAKMVGNDPTGTSVSGSLRYIAPDQLRAEPPTPQSDIYSLGIVLYEIFTGEYPYPNVATWQLVNKHMMEMLPDIAEKIPDLPSAVNEVIQKATAKETKDRYADAREVAAALHRAFHRESRAVADWDDSVEVVNPYKGLRAFQEADAADFFGREALIDQLLGRCVQDDPYVRFLAVVGPSGSGKSSVVRAGLVPQIRGGALPNSDSWFVVDMVPGTQPLRQLEAALLSVALKPPSRLAEMLRADVGGLLWAVDRVLADVDGDLVLIIDQFEEVFTMVDDEAERNHFLELLRTAVTAPDSRVRVMITLRADFTDRPLEYVNFGELMRTRTEFVLPLSAEEIERAITGPANRVGLQIDTDLIAAIIADVSEEPGALPLLQYALTEVFERREGRRLTLAGYQASGGVLGALARRAEEVFVELPEHQQTITRQILLRMVTLGEGTEDTRRRARRSELAEVVNDPQQLQQVLDAFGKYRLLTFDVEPGTREPMIEVAHEALIREWQRLRQWLDTGRADVRLQRVLAGEAAEWNKFSRDPSFLMSGARLTQYEEWLKTTDLMLTQNERAFLDASFEERQRRDAAEIARREREEETAKRAETFAARAAQLRRAAIILGVVIALAVLAGIGLTVQVFNTQAQVAAGQTEVAAVEPTLNEADTRIAGVAPTLAEASTQVAGVAPTLNDANTQVAGAQIQIVQANEQATAANQQAARAGTQAAGAETQAAEARLEAADAQTQVIVANTQVVSANTQAAAANTQVAEAGTQVAGVQPTLNAANTQVGGVEPTVNAANTQAAGAQAQVDEASTQAAGANTQAAVANTQAAGAQGQADSANTQVADAQAQAVIAGTRAAAADTQVADAGTQVAGVQPTLNAANTQVGGVVPTVQAANTQAAGAQAQVDDARTQIAQATAQLATADAQVAGVQPTLDSAGTQIAGVAPTLDTANTQVAGVVPTVQAAEATLNAGATQIAGVQPTLDTAQTQVAGVQPTVAAAETQIAGVVPTLNAVEAEVRTQRQIADALRLVRSADQLLQAGNPDLAIALVLEAYRLNPTLGETQRILNDATPLTVRLRLDSSGLAAFSPGGDQIAIADGDNIQIWGLSTRGLLHTLNADSITVMVYSPDGQQLVAGTRGGEIYVWDAGTGQERFELRGHRGRITDIAYNPERREIVSGDSDGVAYVWDVERGERINQLPEPHPFPIVRVIYNENGSSAFSFDLIDTRDLQRRQPRIGVFNFGQAGAFRTPPIYRGFSLNGRIAYTGGDGTGFLTFYDADSTVQQRTFQQHNATDDYIDHIAFSEDGRYIIVEVETRSYTNDRQSYIVTARTVELWEIATGAEIRQFQFNQEDPRAWDVNSIAISADGRFALFGGRFSSIQTVTLFDVGTGLEVRRFTGHTAPVGQVAFSPDGRYGYSIADNSEARIWDIGAGELNTLSRTSIAADSITAFGLNADGSRAYVAVNDRSITTYDLITGQEVPNVDVFTGEIRRVAFSPTQPQALVLSVDSLTLYDLTSLQFIHNFPGLDVSRIDALGFSPDGAYLFYADGGRVVRWQIETRSEFGSFNVDADYIAVNENGEYLAAATDNSIAIIDMVTSEVLQTFSYNGRGSILSLDYGPNDDTLITGVGEPDNAVIVWDIRTGAPRYTMIGHTAAVNAAVYSPLGEQALSGSDDGTLILWDLTSGQAIRQYRGHTAPVAQVQFSPGGGAAYSLSTVLTDGVIGWRVETARDTVNWTYANRYIREINCQERAQYGVEPACENGVIPTPQPTPTSQATATPTASSTTRPTLTPSPTDLPEATIITTGGAQANMRENAGQGYDLVAQLDNGTRVQILEEQRDIGWVRIRVISTGQEGWVRVDFLDR